MTKYLNEDKFLKALTEINDINFNEINWLNTNFDLYKQTLNWPNGFPPIKRSHLVKRNLNEKFNSVYRELLDEQNYQLDDNEQTLTINNNKL